MTKKTSPSGFALSSLLQWAYVAIICLVFFSAYEYVFDKKIDTNGDNVSYYILGQSLAQGTGYTNIYQSEPSPNTHYPPGYPAIIAATMQVFHPSIDMVKRLNGMFFLASAILLFFFARKVTNQINMSLVIVLLVLMNPVFLRFSVIMMSEIPFVFFSFLTFFLVFKMDLEKPFYKNGLFYASLIAMAIGFYVRTTGITLLAGISLYLLFKRKWGYILGYTAGIILLALPWSLRNQRLGGHGYLDQLLQVNPYRPEMGSVDVMDMLVRFVKNLIRYITREIPFSLTKFPEFNYKTPLETSEWVFGILLISVIGYGLWKLTRYRMLITGYIIGTFGILLFWPDVWTGPRFVMPLVPIFVMLFCLGVYDLVVLLTNKVGWSLKPGLLSVLPFSFLLLFLYLSPEIDKAHNVRNNNYHVNYQRYFSHAQYAKEHYQPDDIICCRKGNLFYLFSGLKTVNFKSTLDKEELIADLATKSVDYVVLDHLGFSSTARYLAPAIQKYPQKFLIEQHLKEPDSYILKFRPDLGYSGEFDAEDKRCGYGTYKYPNGDFFEGNWMDGMRQGEGTLRLANGQVLVIGWKADKPHGDGVLYTGDMQPVNAVRYDNGRVVSSKPI